MQGTRAQFDTLKPMRILVIDDDPLILEVMSATLQADGHLVSGVSTGAEGIKIVASSIARGAPIDVVITDFSMPQMDGVAVARSVKQIRGATKVVLLSGRSRELDARGESPVDMTLTKPPRLSDLRAALAR